MAPGLERAAVPSRPPGGRRRPARAARGVVWGHHGGCDRDSPHRAGEEEPCLRREPRQGREGRARAGRLRRGGLRPPQLGEPRGSSARGGAVRAWAKYGHRLHGDDGAGDRCRRSGSSHPGRSPGDRGVVSPAPRTDRPEGGHARQLHLFLHEPGVLVAVARDPPTGRVWMGRGCSSGAAGDARAGAPDHGARAAGGRHLTVSPAAVGRGGLSVRERAIRALPRACRHHGGARDSVRGGWPVVAGEARREALRKEELLRAVRGVHRAAVPAGPVREGRCRPHPGSLRRGAGHAARARVLPVGRPRVGGCSGRLVQGDSARAACGPGAGAELAGVAGEPVHQDVPGDEGRARPRGERGGVVVAGGGSGAGRAADVVRRRSGRRGGRDRGAAGRSPLAHVRRRRHQQASFRRAGGCVREEVGGGEPVAEVQGSRWRRGGRCHPRTDDARLGAHGRGGCAGHGAGSGEQVPAVPPRGSGGPASCRSGCST